MARIDTLIESSPAIAADSLKVFSVQKLSRYNRGYYFLLDVMAKDKNYFTFQSDSLIKLSADILARKKNEYPLNYARALLYKGLVRYRMGITDSTAYGPIKEGVDFLVKKKIENSTLLVFSYGYLGMIHQENNNFDYSVNYLKKAISYAKHCKTKEYLFNSCSEIAWSYLLLEKFDTAKQYIDTLDAFINITNTQKTKRDHLLAVYYEYTDKYDKALLINKQLLTSEKNYEDVSKMYYRISKNYKDLDKTDSALYYAEKAEKCIQDSNYYLNYLYYTTIGEFSEELKLWQKSANAYKKAYILRNKAVDKELDTQILELEKKYDLSDAENRALRYKNRIITIGIIGILLFAVLATMVFLLRQKTKIAAMKMQFAEKEKEKAERELIEKEFMLPMYQRISQRNAAVKSFLTDLKANLHLSNNIVLEDKANKIYQDFISSSNINPREFLTGEKLKEFTGLEIKNLNPLNDNEKMLLVFAALKLDNKQIAILFNTSESGIRGRKAKLRIKLQEHNIEVKNIIL